MFELRIQASALDDASGNAAEQAAMIEEQSFVLLYERTARPIWAYLSRVARDSSVADDLLQEVYHRYLRADVPEMNATEEKNYLFRIATNLLRDRLRAMRSQVALSNSVLSVTSGEQLENKSDLARALAELGEREREILWLAYAEGFSHREIAAATGVREQSVRPLLHRAKTKVATWLRRRGFAE